MPLINYGLALGDSQPVVIWDFPAVTVDLLAEWREPILDVMVPLWIGRWKFLEVLLLIAGVKVMKEDVRADVLDGRKETDVIGNAMLLPVLLESFPDFFHVLWNIHVAVVNIGQVIDEMAHAISGNGF